MIQLRTHSHLYLPIYLQLRANDLFFALLFIFTREFAVTDARKFLTTGANSFATT